MSKSSNITLSEFYNNDWFSPDVSFVKLLLMPFVFFALLGFPTAIGSYVSVFSNFAALAFFIFCGFFTLAPDRDARMKKLDRAVKRSFKFFLKLFVFYLIINIIYLALNSDLVFFVSEEFLRKRTFFNFIVLNIWPLPVGNSIWFIHSLFYAYLFFFIAEKLRLSKFHIPLLIVLLLFTLLSGELASLTGFPYFGYNYIPGGLLTKALPFMLIGMIIRKNVDKLARFPWFVYLIAFAFGIGFTIAEYFTLKHFHLYVYSGNAIGYAIMAISVCCFALCRPRIGKHFIGVNGGSYAHRMYVLCQPVSLLTWILFALDGAESFYFLIDFRSPLCFVFCLVLAILADSPYVKPLCEDLKKDFLAPFLIIKKKLNKKRKKNS